MYYGVLYTVDIPWDISILGYKPPCPKRWNQTEGDEQYEYSYLEGPWTRGKHRKWVGELPQKQFDKFVGEMLLYAEDVQTMGSLGVPWTESGFGIAPAISFRSDDEDAILGAYVTPLLEKEDQEKLIKKYGEDTEEWWEHVREEVINHYGTSGIKPYPARESILLEGEE